MSPVDSLSTASVTERLDRLPLTPMHLRVLTGSGIGWALDAMDVGLISFIIAALVQEWGISPAEGGLIASIGFVGMAVGAAVGGLLADRFGRRHVFALTLLLYGVATGGSALVGGVAALLVLRFLVGLGLGAELPVASTYVGEFAPARLRGRLIVILEAFWALGWTASAVVGYLVIPGSPSGWRWAFALGALPAMWALVVRLRLPESPRWLARHGRNAEAHAAVVALEAAAGARPAGHTVIADVVPASTDTGGGHAPADASGAATPSVTASSAVSDAAPVGRGALTRLAGLWSGEFRARTAALWVVWVCVNFAYYGAFIWIPSILVADGFDLVKSFGYTLVITLAQIPGYAAAAWLIEKWGRRIVLSVFLAGAAASAVCFGTAHSTAAVLAFGMALSFFNLGAWGALYAVTPEIYPTSLRGTGAGWAAAAGRVAAIVAPLLVPVLLAAGGSTLAFGVFAVFFIVAAGAAWGLIDLRGIPLDDR